MIPWPRPFRAELTDWYLLHLLNLQIDPTGKNLLRWSHGSGAIDPGQVASL